MFKVDLPYRKLLLSNNSPLSFLQKNFCTPYQEFSDTRSSLILIAISLIISTSLRKWCAMTETMYIKAKRFQFIITICMLGVVRTIITIFLSFHSATFPSRNFLCILYSSTQRSLLFIPVSMT